MVLAQVVMMNSEIPLLPAGGAPPAGPQPMDGLQSNTPPPFLTKTYDMVDDAATETIVSWSKGNNSFVIWNPPEFSQDLLPKYFKHNNFSSFVRQLNTYGFRKVDPDRWEFANEGFLRGQRELLRGIHRRKPAAHSQQQQQAAADGALGPCVEVGRLGLEKEIEMLKRDKSLLMLELVRLRQEQQNTEHELQVMGERLQATEQRQQQIMAFLAKAVQTPGFLAHLVEQNENNKCMAASARKKRRLPKEEDEGEVEDSVGRSTPTDNQIITLQNNREVVGHIMQLLNPSDDLSLTIDNSYLDSLLQDYTSAPAGSEGNSLNRHSGVTLTDLSTGLAENLQSDPALTDLRNNEGIVQLPQSPTSDIARLAGGENLEQGNGSSQSGNRDSRDSNIESIDLNGRGPGVSTEVEEVSSSINSSAVVPGANDVFWEQYLTEEPENPAANQDSVTHHPRETKNRAWEYTRASIGSFRDAAKVPQARNFWDKKPSVSLVLPR